MSVFFNKLIFEYQKIKEQKNERMKKENKGLIGRDHGLSLNLDA